MTAVFRSLENIIDTVQRRPSSKDSCEEKIKQLITDNGWKTLWFGGDSSNARGLNHIVNFILTFKDLRDDAANRLIQFISSVANFEEFAENDTQPLFTSLFDKLTPFCTDTCPVRRLRASSLIVQMIKKLKHEEYLSDEQFEELASLAPSLAVDKVPAIRCEGIRLLAKLQDPRDPACVYMNKILFHMGKDPKAEVRRTCVEVIALCSRSLTKIQRRSMDVSASVRKQVYLVYAKRLKLRVLQLTDRTHILSRGLMDRSPSVVQVVIDELLPNWLSQCDGNLLNLLDNLDPYHKPETTVRVIEIILEKAKKENTLEEFIKNFVENHLPNGDAAKEDSITAPILIVWRELIVFLKKHGDDELCHAFLFKVLPATGRLAHLMVRTVGKSETSMSAMDVVNHRLVCTQLILLLSHADFSDFAGKSRLNEAIKTFLAQPQMEHFSEYLVDLLSTLHDNKSDEVFREVLEVISEIESPFMDAQDQVNVLSRSMCGDEEDAPMDVDSVDNNASKIQNSSARGEEPIAVVQARVQITLLREKIENLVATQQFLLAQEAKSEIDKLQAVVDEFEQTKKQQEKCFLSNDDDFEKSFERGLERERQIEFKDVVTDDQTIRRCLAIMSFAIQKATPKNLDTMLRNFIEQRALQAICEAHVDVRAEAVRCLTLGCILNKDFAKVKIPILTHIAKSDVENIRVIALKGIFDLLLRYGIKAFSEEETSMLSTHLSTTSASTNNSSEALQAIITFLADFLKLKSEKILEVVIEGLCKLMFVGHLVSPRILAHLLSFWFNINYAKNATIIHCLSLFFEAYPRMSKERMDVVREAFFPCVRLFFDASDTSALATVSVDRVVDTMVSLCDIRCIPAEQLRVDDTPTPHDLLAEDLLSKLLKDPYCSEVRHYCRALSRLVISASADHRALLRLSRKLSRKIDSAMCKKQLQKFEQSVKKFVEDETQNEETQNETVAPKEEEQSESEDDAAAPLAHDVALRKRLRRSTQLESVFSDSD